MNKQASEEEKVLALEEIVNRSWKGQTIFRNNEVVKVYHDYGVAYVHFTLVLFEHLVRLTFFLSDTFLL